MWQQPFEEGLGITRLAQEILKADVSLLTQAIGHETRTGER